MDPPHLHSQPLYGEASCDNERLLKADPAQAALGPRSRQNAAACPMPGNMAVRRWRAGTLHPSFRRRIRNKTAVSEFLRRKQAASRRIHADYIVNLAVQRNVILKPCPEQNDNTFDIVFRFCIHRIETGGLKACILAPTVPLLKQYFKWHWQHHLDRGRGTHRARLIIGTPDVDAWDRAHWRYAVERCDLVLTSPQLFLDAMESGHLNIADFGALAFDQCQHCIGRHPFAEIVRRVRLRDGVRLLGVCPRLWKAKHKRSEERAQSARSLQAALRAIVVAS